MATTKSKLTMVLSSGRVIEEKNENEGLLALDAAPGKKAFPFVRDGSQTTNRHSAAGLNDRNCGELRRSTPPR